MQSFVQVGLSALGFGVLGKCLHPMMNDYG